jgi:hypothetical protein
MFELMEIAKHGEFRNRIFPVVLSGSGIYEVSERLKYVKYWELESKRLNKAMKQVDSQANLHGIREELDLFTEIRATISSLMDIWGDMNALSPQQHQDANFKELFEAIDSIRGFDREMQKEIATASFVQLQSHSIPSRDNLVSSNVSVPSRASAIANATSRKNNLESSGLDSSEVQDEILDLKRQERFSLHPRKGMALCNGRFVLSEELGRGGFGTVWRAKDNASASDVAIKILHPHRASCESRQRFFRGAERMSRIGPGVVKVLIPRGEEDGICFYVMEVVEGGNLFEAVSSGRIGKDQAVRIMVKLCEILADAERLITNSARFAHRDVKPANVLLGTDGDVKLSDFDLVAASDTTGGTRSGGALGSIPYAAPEQLTKPDEADSRADIYGIAVTGIFVLYGRNIPHYEFLEDREGFIRKLDTSEHVKRCLAFATATDPRKRFQSLYAFRDSLLGDTSLLPKRATVSLAPKRTRETGAGVRTASGQKKRFAMPRPTKRQIEKALHQFDETLRETTTWRSFGSNRGHRYAIKANNKLYPVKMILELAGGKERGSLSGTMKQYQKIVVALGIEVVEKDTALEKLDVPNPMDSK